MKTTPLKTTQAQVIETCEIAQDNGDLVLKGYKDANDKYLKYNSQNLNLDENNTFHTYFDETCCFYYQLTHLNGSQPKLSEVGVGELVKKEDSYLIERKYCLYNQTSESDITPSPSFYCGIVEGEYDYFQVSHYPVSNALQLFLNENSVPCSQPIGPSSVVLEPDTVLGRTDKNIQAIKIQDLCKQTNKTVVVPTKAAPKKPAKGALIIDSKDGKLKLYNGKDWKVLLYEDT